MRALIAGVAAALLLTTLSGGALAALWWAAPIRELTPTALWHDVYLQRVVGFTLYQAALSTLLSVGLGLAVARALARRPRFVGRVWLLRLFGLPLVVPTIVAVFGVVAVYGQIGWLNRFAALFGVEPGRYLYGLGGILIAHVFFNLPLTVRLLLPLWQTVPGESWRLAAQLGMRSGAVWRYIEWPLLRQGLPGVAGLIFMLCFSSFAVVLTLGGGPAATTVEVAIYQALRFDFDLPRAVLLALLQLGLCALLLATLQGLTRTPAFDPLTGIVYSRPDGGGAGARLIDTLLIAAAALATALPLLAIVVAGLSGPLATVLSDPVLWAATLRSLLIALSAGTLALLFGWALLLGGRELRDRRGRSRLAALLELPGVLILVVPPLVLGTGFFVLLRPLVDVFSAAVTLALVVIVNALMGMPYVLRLLGPPLAQNGARYELLCASLNISGWRRFRLIDWPQLRRPAGLAAALSAALATGDLGVIALFGNQHTATLPLLLYQRLGSYQSGAAAVTALLLAALCLTLFVLIERLLGGARRA